MRHVPIKAPDAHSALVQFGNSDDRLSIFRPEGPILLGVFNPEAYELIDFGEGRRLERMGAVVVDRPCPAADGSSRRTPQVWAHADIRYERIGEGRGQWKRLRSCPDHWSICHRSIRFELRPTPLGQLGIFPEQAENWDWIESRVRRAGRPLSVLNLFAYTGGATFAAATAGAEVVHVDAAKSVVAWARRNAGESNLVGVPIRWIVEDASKFVEREVRRGRRYDAVILDPPSYGHGPKGEPWKIDRHLDQLLAGCGALLADQGAFLLLTCHTPTIMPARLRRALTESLAAAKPKAVQVKSLCLYTADRRKLPSGLAATWTE